MGDLYGVLGLPRDASGDAIKAAYRALARELHPDANVANDIKAGDAGSEDRAQRLREVNQAYETLGDPQARAAYDRDLARQRAGTRRRYAIFAASTLATFALTMTAVSFAVRWHLEAAAHRAASVPGPPQEVSREVPNGPGEAAAHGGQGAKWATYRNATFGFALRYPADVFALDSGQSTGTVQTFVSRDGRAVLRILAARNTAGLTLSAFRHSLMKKRYAGASFDAAPQRDHWFALSGTRGENAFFERVTFSCDRKSMHGWQMVYPSNERTTYDKLARQVLRNHPHGNGPGAACSDAGPKAQARRRHTDRARW
jgi:curved DNA-binding protein CbpA